MLYDDQNTKVILIYIEGLKEGQGFIKLARRITKEKPVIVLKSGRTESAAEERRRTALRESTERGRRLYSPA